MSVFDELTSDGYSPTLGAYVLDDGTGRLVTIPTDDDDESADAAVHALPTSWWRQGGEE